MDLWKLILGALVGVVIWLVHRRGRGPAPGQEWRDSWRELPLRERLRIARGAQRGADFGPDETALAAGAARLQQRMVPFPIGTWAALLVAIFMTSAVTAVGNFKPAALGLAITGLLAWRLVRVHRTRRNLELLAQAEPAETAGLNDRR